MVMKHFLINQRRGKGFIWVTKLNKMAVATVFITGVVAL